MSQEGLFGKRISELEASDLLVLGSTAEGWFCEYKQQIVKPPQVAKSISSFANTYGGWLFYGVRANPNKENNCAEELCGISLSEISAAEVWIRQAVSSSMSPAAYFEHKVIRGPLVELGLKSDRAIIAIYVPQGTNAPYVHSSGKIYRRVADESDPRAETDRHYLDLLWNRSKGLKDDLKEFILKEPPRQDPNRRQPVLRLLIFHDVWQDRDQSCVFEDEKFYELMSSGSLAFDTVYPTNTGYLARQTSFNSPLGLLFGWHHRRGCIDEITIPLSTYYLDDDGRVRDLSIYQYAQRYVKACRDWGARHAYLVDLSIVYSLLLAIFLRLNEILLKENVGTQVTFKVQIAGMSGYVPFLDVPEFIDAVEAFGIPVIQDHIMYAPSGFTPDSLGTLVNIANPRKESEKDPYYCAMINCTVVFFIICRSLGVDVRATGYDGTEDGVMRWHDKLMEAATKSYGVSAALRDRDAKRREV